MSNQSQTSPRRPASKKRTRRGLLAAGAVAAAVAVALHLPLQSPAYAATGGTSALTAPAHTLPDSFADLVEAVAPAVVAISARHVGVAGDAASPAMPEFRLPEGHPLERYFRDFFGNQGQPVPMPGPEARAVGSGFIIDADGLVVTNNHVIDGAQDIEVVLKDGSRLEAKVVGTDDKTDIALLRVSSDHPLPFVKFGDSDHTRVGDWVVAVGNPFGLGGTVTAGIVSARGRDISSGPYDDFLQVDAPINRGNSGGPLFDRQGHVVGINTAIFSPSGGNVGIGFAIPSNLAAGVVADLRDDGRVERGWLGVQIQAITPDLAESLGRADQHGALVAAVSPDSPAEKAGLRRGDVIVGLDGKPVDDMHSLPRMVAAVDPGKQARLQVWRDGKSLEVEARIGQLPDGQQLAAAGDTTAPGDEATPTLGLALSTLDPDARRQLGLGEDAGGVLVSGVHSDGPAARKGLRRGDVILMVGHTPVSQPADVVHEVERAAGAKRKAVMLLVHRNGNELFVAVPIAKA